MMCSTCERLFLNLFAIICTLLFFTSLGVSVVGGLLRWRTDLFTTLLQQFQNEDDKYADTINIVLTSEQLATAYDDYVAIILFITGLIIAIFSALGFIGSVWKNRFLLTTVLSYHLVCMVILAVVIIFFGVADGWIGQRLINLFRQNLFDNYDIPSSLKSASGFTKFWDVYQTQLHCCGVINYADFVLTKGYNQETGVVPLSCCRNHSISCTSNPGPENSYIAVPCAPILARIARRNKPLILTGLALGVAINMLVLVTICGALWAVCHKIQSGGQLLQPQYRVRSKFLRKFDDSDETDKSLVKDSSSTDLDRPLEPAPVPIGFG